MSFTNSITGAQGNLVVPLIQSPNFVHGVQGWQINKDGSAEFQDIIIPTGSGGAVVTFSAVQPSNPNVGDLWYNVAQGNQLAQWNGVAWLVFQYGTAAVAASAITQQLLADGAVGSSQVEAGTVVAGIVDTTLINAATFVGSTFEGDNFVINDDGMFFYA